MKPIKKIFNVLLAVVLVCTMVTWPSKPGRAAEPTFVSSYDQLIRLINQTPWGGTLDVELNGFSLERDFTINKPITINFKSAGKDRALLGCNGFRAIYIKSYQVHLNFDNVGFGSSSNCPENGGAIYIDGNYVSIRGARFDSCSSVEGKGGSIYINGVGAVIEECTFTGGGYTPQIFGAEQGGAIYINDINATIKNCRFDGCVSRSEGGAIYANKSNAHIEGCIFTNCRSNTNDGGAIFVDSSNSGVVNSIFDGCTAEGDGGDGGAIKLTWNWGVGPLWVENCYFNNCVAKDNGHWVDSGNKTTIWHCTRPYDDKFYYKCKYNEYDPMCRAEYLTKVDANPPSCTKDGWKPWWKCRCGLIYSDSKPSGGTLIFVPGMHSIKDMDDWRERGEGYLPPKGHDFKIDVSGDTITVQCKNDPWHKVSLNLAVKDTTYSGKAENAEISGNTNSANWKKYGYEYDFYYTDGGGNRLSGGPVNAGTYKAVIEVKKDGVVQKTLAKSFTINTKTITSQFTSLDKYSIKYGSGEPYKVNVTVKDGNTPLIKDVDYTVTGDLEKAGVAGAGGPYTVTIKGIGNYEGTVDEQWYITAAAPLTLSGSLSASPITFGDKLIDSTITDTGCVVKSGEVEVGGGFAWEDGDIEPEVIDSGGIGYTVVFTPNSPGYGTLKIDVPVTVNPYDLSKGNPVYITVPGTYTGEDLKDYITVDYDVDPDLDFVKGVDYDVTAPASVIDPGDYTATISFKGNYTGSVSKPFKVIRYLQEEDIAIEVPEFSNESELEDGSITVWLGGITVGTKLSEATDYDVVYNLISYNEPAIYNFSATITFKGIYGGVVVKEFTVILPNYEPPAPTPSPTPTPVPQETTYIPSFSPGLPALPSTQGTIGDGTDSSTIKIRVNTSNGNATIANIPESTISSVASTLEKPIVIDVSGSGRDGKKVSKVTIPRATVENLARALDTPINVKDRFAIIIDTAVLKFDTKAFVSIAGQAKGDNMQIVVEEKSQTRLNNSQKSALETFNNGQGKSVAQTFEAYIISGGKVISTFEGGQISIGMIDFKIPAGKNPKYYHVYYLPEAGEPELCTTWVEDGMLFYGTGHFSDYAIVYDESMENGIDREVFRLYDKNTGEHLLTTDDNEVKVLTAAGWVLEGSVGKGANYGEEVFRLYNAATREHLYTADKNECNTLTAERGWVYDNNGKPMIYGLLSGKAMYRVYNASLPSVASHHYTSDPNEVRVLTTERGYVSDNSGEAVFYLN